MNLRPLVAPAVATALALATASCSAATSGDGAHASDFGHVHDLAYDAESDTLFVATHRGMFSVADDILEGPIGGHTHDFMSFAMAPDGTMIGGGHPDESSGWGNHMGFATSQDRGVTWNSQSLTGAVDFHDIEFAGDGIVGYDSQTGTLAYSVDGLEWEARNALGLYDLAVSPGEADTWIATTPDDLITTTDGGANFAPIAEAPSGLIYLDWSSSHGLWAITDDGSLLVSVDAGLTWDDAGKAPAVGVIEVTPNGTVFVATASGVFASSDGGASWEDVA